MNNIWFKSTVDVARGYYGSLLSYPFAVDLNIVPAIHVRVVSQTQTEQGSGGGRVVKLLTCGAIIPGLDSRPRHLKFRDL